MADYGDHEPADEVTLDIRQPTATAGWCDDLDDVLRAAGLQVVEVDGWERRARSGNRPYTAVPTHVMVHHTASNTSAANDVAYITHNAQYAPLANILLDRTGVVWLCAAGPTNTNGTGSDTWGGGTPPDSMNACAIGIEIANNGTGEPYSTPQQRALHTLCVELLKYIGRSSHYLRAHFEWSPGRKIDPAGSSWYAVGSDMWNMVAMRSNVQELIDAQTPGEPVVSNSIAVLSPSDRILDSRNFGVEAGRLGDARPGDSGIRQLNALQGVINRGVAAMVTITALDVVDAGYITLWQNVESPRPVGSCLNYQPGDAPIANTTIVPLASDGSFQLFAKGDIHVIVDLVAVYD